MTDNLNESHQIPTNELLNQQSLDNESDFSDDEDVDNNELDVADGELTPNDIFGLDPLDVLTLEELAEYLKVSPAAVRRVIKEQNLPGRNIGGEWRFLRDAVANWLRGQEAPAIQQQKAREDYSKPKETAPRDDDSERFSRPPQRSYQAEQSGGDAYRPRQRFPEGGQQSGNRGSQYGGSQYGGGQAGGQYGGGQSSGQYGGGGYGGGSGSSYSRPPRRPFRATEGGEGGYGNGSEAGGGGGYSVGGAGGARYSGGGYAGGGQRFGGGPKRKNKRQVFDNERGKRLDRRKEGPAPEGEE